MGTKCDYNCFECKFLDCINDGDVTESEIQQSQLIEKEADAFNTKKLKERPPWWNKDLTPNEKARLRYALDSEYRSRKQMSSQKARKPKQKVWVIKPVKWETKYALDYIRAQREKRLKNDI